MVDYASPWRRSLYEERHRKIQSGLQNRDHLSRDASFRIELMLEAGKPAARETKVAQRFQADLACPDLRIKIFRFRFDPNHRFVHGVSFRQEGRIARRHERGTGCGGRKSAGAPSRSQGELNLVSGRAARKDERRSGVRQNRVVPTPVAGAKLRGGEPTQPGSAKP